MNNERKELIELSQSFASLETTFKQAKADYDTAKKAGTDQPDKLDACMNAMYAAISNVHQRMDRMQASAWNYQDSHAEGHPYKLLTATHKSNYLKATGMDNDYDKPVKKWANASKDVIQVKSN